MSVLIRGMGFPTKENFMTQLYLICDKDGDWYAVDTTNKDLYKLIEVKEPHGSLVDFDQMVEDYWDGALMVIDERKFKQIESSIIIEAEGREE